MLQHPLVRTVTATGTIAKQADHRGRPVFVLPVVFTLENAVTGTFLIQCDRRKDLPGRLARYQADATAGHLRAEIHGGHVCSTETLITNW